MRLGSGFLAALLLFAAAHSSEAALKRYRLYTVNITDSPNQSPNPNNTLPGGPGLPDDAAIVDTNGPSPILRKLQFRSDNTTTINVPGLTTTIFISNLFWEGPDAPDLRRSNGVPDAFFTGTGSAANGSTLRWGSVTGWSITGQSWCNSNPAVICTLAMLLDEATIDPRFNSGFYDLGTWSFHGTGFTSIPWVHSYFTNSFGNNQRWLRGGIAETFSVPALPLLGLAVLGTSIAVAGFTLAMRRRD
jgi:hypothetical protein